MAAILNSAILDSDTSILDSNTLLSSLRFTKKHFSSTLNLTQTNSIWLTWWWQPSWILPSWIQPFCTKLWLKLVQSDSNSFILTQLDDGSHLELCHHGFTHFAQRYFTHSFWLNLMMAAILDSAILDFPLKLTHTYQDWFPPFAQKKLHWFILTHIGDGSHLEFDHHWFIHFSMSSQSHSHLPRLVPSICFCTKKTSLIHSDSYWWWQTSWILACGIQTLPSWIQTPCFLFSDSLKNPLTPLWLWLKLIQSDSNSFILI